MVTLALQAGPAPTPAADTPLRTVVYKISTQRENAPYIEHVMRVDDKRTIFIDEGTTTVDVMVNASDSLGVRVTELTRERVHAALQPQRELVLLGSPLLAVRQLVPGLGERHPGLVEQPENLRVAEG